MREKFARYNLELEIVQRLMAEQPKDAPVAPAAVPTTPLKPTNSAN
jgi:hypothetical protein